MMFGEKKLEYDHISKTNIPVCQTAKYISSRNAAINLLKEKDFMSESDFWILMNRSKGGDTMLYSGLIISHNGCLKINDNLPDEQKFKPECVMVNENGYCGSLVFTYICPEQRMYEVGEVSSKNCKNEYPYAMALKRCFDRVVLKQCKLAFYGIYSDSEAEEFKNTEKIDELNKGFQDTLERASAMATNEQVEAIKSAAIATKTDVMKSIKNKGKTSLNQLTHDEADAIIAALNKRADAV